MTQLAFYKGRTRLFDKLVQFWLNEPYSHVELIHGGLSYSSSMMDGGVRCKKIDYSHPERWDIVTLAYGDSNVVNWFQWHDSAAYDFRGLLGFVLPWETQDKRKYFCSEAVGASLGIINSHRLSPYGLYKELQNENRLL